MATELRAHVSTPTSNKWQVIFEYRTIENGELGPTNHSFPSVTIPCDSFTHAQTVVAAFNRPTS